MAQDHVEAGVVEHTRIEIKTTGFSVRIGENPHARTNHFIRQSRPYLESHKLREYWNCCGINMIALFNTWLFISIIGCLLYYIAAIVMVLANILWLCVFLQHQVVVYGTIPHILKQPIVPNNALNFLNDFVEIELHQVKGAYAASQDAGIGIIQSSQGKIKFHVLSEEAASNIRATRRYSIIGFSCSLLMVIFSIVMIPIDIIYLNNGLVS